MEHRPPVGGADVATKRDLDVPSDRIDARFEAFEVRFEALSDRFPMTPQFAMGGECHL